jgi:hypothetical protein
LIDHQPPQFTTMRIEISAQELPKYLGRTIFLHDEETKRDEVVKNIELRHGWIRGASSNNSFIDLALNYNLKKIFVEV